MPLYGLLVLPGHPAPPAPQPADTAKPCATRGAAQRRPLGRCAAVALACLGIASLLLVGVGASAAPAPGAGAAGVPMQGPGAQGRPYAVVDKSRATISVHFADGRLAGESPALLGSALGDESLPGVGERSSAGRLKPQDKTTAAGRFIAHRGRNLQGETLLWLDYDAALAIHRLRPGRSAEQRARALAADDASLRRLTDGCVVVPGAFFDDVVLPVLGGGGVVVVLPEAVAWAGGDDAH